MSQLATLAIALGLCVPVVCQGDAQDPQSDSGPDFNEVMSAVSDAGVAIEERKARSKEDEATRIGDLFSKVGLLDGLELDFRVVDGREGEQTIGAAFDYTVEQPFATRYYEGIPVRGGFFELNANGTVVFDSAVNPRNLLVGEARIGFHQHFGMDAGPETLDLDEMRTPFRKADAKGRREMLRQIRDAVQNDFLKVKLDVNASIESNQRTTQRNLVVGASLYLDADSYDPESALSILNVFDYPFLLTRMATKFADDGIDHVRGDAIPVVRVSIDQVNPEGMDPRARVGDTGNYQRLSIEAGMRTGFIKIGKQKFDIAMSFRYFQEFGASGVVKAADLDRYDYFSIGMVQSDGGLFATYSTGRLPFDLRDDNAVELGWQFDF